jgi:ribosomal protein L40E/tetratricopeptide (TPR) repeat protein
MGLFITECYKCGTPMKRYKKCPNCSHKLSDFGMEIEKCPSCKKWNTKENDSCWNCGFSFSGDKENKKEINLEVNPDNKKAKNISCPECGAKNPNYANFCQKCGKKIHSEKTVSKLDEAITTKDSSSALGLGTFINQTKTGIKTDILLLKEFVEVIELIIKKYGSNKVNNEKELEEQIREIDSQINFSKIALDKKLKVLKSEMIQIDKIRDENKPFNITYSISLKEQKSNDGFERLFTNSNNEKTILKVFIHEDTIDIPDIDFHTINLVESENKKFILAYKDQYFVVKDGIRQTIDGEVVFVNDKELFLIDTLERPNDGKLAENGNFIVNDWMTPELGGTFYAFNSDVNILIKEQFNSNLGENGLSENGQYAVLETLYSESDDCNKIFFFDLNNKKLLWERKRDLGNIKSFKFDLNGNILIISYDKHGNYCYSFKGEFLDQNKLEKYSITYGNGYELFDIARKKMEKLDYKDSNLSDYAEILSILKKSSNKDISAYTKARVYRSIGEIYYNFDKTDEALKNFGKALKYDPKVGIKRLYDKLNSS